MAPRRTGRPSSRQSSVGGSKGKQKATEDTQDLDSPSGSDSTGGNANAGKNVQWTVDDETALIDLIFENKAIMGDGGNFKPAFWAEVAHRFPALLSGKTKTAESCKEKWKRLKSTYSTVHKIVNTSGLAYSLENGANIGLESQHVWDDIVKNTKGASKFKHRGWTHYEKMLQLLPSKSTGTHGWGAQFTLIPSHSHQPPMSSSSNIPAESNPSDVNMINGESVMLNGGTENVPFTRPRVGINTSSDTPSTPFLPVSAPASAPSTCIGSAVSSIKPSSSISARMSPPKKRKADDDLSMVSAAAASGSVVSATSGTSSTSRKRRTMAKELEGIAVLKDGISRFDRFTSANTDLIGLMGRLVQKSDLPTTAGQMPPLPVPPLSTPAMSLANKRSAARSLLLEKDKDFLTEEQLITMFDIMGKSDDCVESYYLLATLPSSDTGVRRGWLRKKLSELLPNTFPHV